MAWFDIPARQVIRLVALIILTAAAVFFGLWLLVKLWSVVLLAGVALILAAALIPSVNRLTRLVRNRVLAVIIVALTLLAVIALFGVLVAPPMIEQGRDLYERSPQAQERAARIAAERGMDDLRQRIEAFSPRDVANRDLLVSTGLGVVSFVIAFFTVLFLVLYFLLDIRPLERFLYFSTPRAWHRHLQALLPALQVVVGGYIRGQAITSASIGIFTFVLLTVLRVPNALALAGIAAVADLIPLVGVFILMAPIALVALGVSFTTMLIALGAMVAYQQFEDRILVPKVYGATLRLPTIAVVVAILVGAQLLGIMGALIALPIAAAIRVVVEYFATIKHEPPRQAAADVLANARPGGLDAGAGGG